MQPSGSLEALKEKIELFLLGLHHSVLTEPGREVIDLSASHYSLTTEYNKLLCHVWNDQTNLVRQITRIKKETASRMELQFQKFAKGPPGTLILAESRAGPAQLDRRSERSRYGQRLRRFLAQLFPDWKVEKLTSETDLKHSFSGRYTRGLLTRGQQAWAVIGSGEQEDSSAAEGILTYGLIWLDWLRRRNPALVIEGLKVFVPPERAQSTLERLAWMDSKRARWEVYETAEEVRRCDPADVGNLTTSLRPSAEPPPLPHAFEKWIEQIKALSTAIEEHPGRDGHSVLAVRGLSFARSTPAGVVFGVGRSETMLEERTWSEMQELVAKILRYRQGRPEDPLHPFFRLQPERWMQTLLAQQIAILGHDLTSVETYAQVPAASGTERGLIDLLAVNSQGRLVVVELKVSEDIHLPLQALDYWMRVCRHLQRGKFERQGAFRVRGVSSQPPLLLLVSPALQFHSTCETILRYFSSSVETVRVGLNENWREELQVVFRYPQ